MEWRARCSPSLHEFLSYFIKPVKRFFPIFFRLTGIILIQCLPWVVPQISMYVPDATIHDLPKRHMATPVDILQPTPWNTARTRPNDASRITITMEQPTKHPLHAINGTWRRSRQLIGKTCTSERTNSALHDIRPVRHSRLYITTRQSAQCFHSLLDPNLDQLFVPRCRSIHPYDPFPIQETFSP